MGELQQLGTIADRRVRLESLRTYVHAHAHDPDGWYMLHLELEHAGEREAAEVALARAVAIDRSVPGRFSIVPAAAPERLQDALEVPGYRVIRELYASDGTRLYEAIDPSSARCQLRVMIGESTDSVARIMERQQLATSYPRCLAISRIVRASDGMPVQVMPWIDDLPIDEPGRLLEPAGARKAIASIAKALAAPHRDGLIVGDLRPCAIFGRLDEPETLQVLGVRQATGGSFGTIAGDVGRFRWYATEEGAEQLDPRTDIYGLGLLLWWTVVGRDPPSLGERLKQRLPATGDAELDRIIAKCTQVQPADRYRDVDELIRDLDALDAPRVGPWLLGERIGGGTTADVYLATHTVDQRKAVVKVFTRARNHEREKAALDAAAKVDGVVRALDASASDVAHPYIALTRAKGESLARLLTRGSLELPAAVSIVRALATSLAAMHDAGVIHRDLRPANIFVELGPPPEVVVIDLDAAWLRDRPELDERQLIGTPSHMAPEQWEMVPDIDERADVYALGLVFFECVTGHHPLTGDALAAWQRAHLDPVRPPVDRPGLAPHLATLIESMIARDRTRRPRSMREVIAGLEPPEPPRSETPPPRPRPRSRWPLIAAGGALLAVAGAGITWKMWPHNRAPVARIEASETRGHVGQTLVFDGSSSSDGDGDALGYAWRIDHQPVSTDPKLEYEFGVPGRHFIVLTVQDAHGARSTQQIGVEIEVVRPRNAREALALYRYELGWTGARLGTPPAPGGTPAAGGAYPITSVELDGDRHATLRYAREGGGMLGVTMNEHGLVGSWSDRDGQGDLMLTFDSDFITADGWWNYGGNDPVPRYVAFLRRIPSSDPASVDQLVQAETAAIEHRDRRALAAVLRSNAFGFGPGAEDIAFGANNLAAVIDHGLGTGRVRVLAPKIGREGDAAWILYDVMIGTRRLRTTQLAVRGGGGWRVAAWHWGEPIRNARASACAAAGKLPVAQRVPARAGDGELEAVFRAAFSSKAASLAALSDRPDLYDVGSDPDEITDHATARRYWERSEYQIRIVDGVAADRVSPDAGWAAANIELRTSRTTQVFRVLAVLLREPAGWRIVQLQWSNAGPVPAAEACQPSTAQLWVTATSAAS